MTSSPGPMPSASSTSTIASVPFATPIVSPTPRYCAASRSKALTFGPRMNAPDSRISSKARFSSGTSGAYCALTSTSGIRGTSLKSIAASAAQNQIGDQDQNSCNDGDFHEAELVVEALVARAERPADGREPEAPDRRADQRQHDVARERDAEDAGGDRHERANDRRHTSDEHRPVLVAVEPRLCAAELPRAEVDPAAVAVEQRPAAVVADPPADDRAGEIAERAGDRDGEIGLEAVREVVAEERERRAERTRGDRAADDHDELARRGQDGVDRHQDEDRIEPVVADVVRQRAGDAREKHVARDYLRAVKPAWRSTLPSAFAAST